LGGTVYFLVLERTGTGTGTGFDGDTWGTGTADFDRQFSEGRNFEGSYSPSLDTKARFVYLYQIVNDRGLRPQSQDNPISPVIFAGEKEDAPAAPPAVDISSFTLKLLVDPRYITSWGAFQG